jgi:ribosomal-protein-alanine N-acetyltransferase
MGDLVAALLMAEAFFAGEQPVLRGDGLVLRPWRDADAVALVGAFADPALRQWHMQSIDEGEAPAWIEARRQRWYARTGVDWVVTAEGSDALLGRIGIHRVALRVGLGEISYWTLAEARGRRIAPRALGLLCDWAFSERGMHRLELNHSVANPASCRVAERAGFTFEGVKRAELLHPDGWHDMHLHARLADDPLPEGPL